METVKIRWEGKNSGKMDRERGRPTQIVGRDAVSPNMTGIAVIVGQEE